MMYRFIPLFAATLLCSAAIADDDKTMRSSEATFKSLDKDTDQRLSQNEVSNDSQLSSHFAALDKNSDGYLTQREYAAHSKPDKRSHPKDY